jgi:hypothetical protein
MTITSNTKSGVDLVDSEDAALLGGSISSNKQTGIIMTNSNLVVDGTTIENHPISAAHVSGGSLTIGNSAISGHSKVGIVLTDSGQLAAATVQFTGSEWGVLAVTGNADVDGCTFSEVQIGVAIFESGSVRNSVFNSPAIAAAQVLGTVEFDTCTFQDAPAGILAGEAQLTISGSTFTNSGVHVEIESGEINISDSQFEGAKGEVGVRIGKAQGTVTGTKFEGGAGVGIFSEGEVEFGEIEVRKAAKAGIVFGDDAGGSIEGSVIQENGAVAIQCGNANPVVRETEIQGHGFFGILLGKGARLSSESNKFESNGVANIWRYHK